jgi:hypothetical protein
MAATMAATMMATVPTNRFAGIGIYHDGAAAPQA